MSKMRPTNIGMEYFISVKNIELAAEPLYPLFLNLIISMIDKHKYPENPKIEKLKPVPKDNNNVNDIISWHPINIVQTFSKVIESVPMLQIVEHMIKID